MAAGKTKMKINSKDFRVGEGGKVNLEKWPTKIEPVYKSKERYKSLLEEHVAKLSVMQELHYASNRHAVLVILQAIDAAEKDGAIRHVMSGVNPQGCLVAVSVSRNGSSRQSAVHREGRTFATTRAWRLALSIGLCCPGSIEPAA
jgi:polyphosphate kinase 2 (PPK2 family)